MIHAQNKTIPCSRVSRAQKLIAMCWVSSRNLFFLSAMAFLIMRIASLRLHPLNVRCHPRGGEMLRIRIQLPRRGKQTRELDEIFSRHNYLPIWMLMRRGNKIFPSKDFYFVDPRHSLPSPPLLIRMVSRRFISHRLLSIRRWEYLIVRPPPSAGRKKSRTKRRRNTNARHRARRSGGVYVVRAIKFIHDQNVVREINLDAFKIHPTIRWSEQESSSDSYALDPAGTWRGVVRQPPGDGLNPKAKYV